LFEKKLSAERVYVCVLLKFDKKQTKRAGEEEKIRVDRQEREWLKR